MKSRFYNWFWAYVLLIIVCLVFWPMFSVQVHQYDYKKHLQAAWALQDGVLTVPHFLYHLATLAIHKLMGWTLLLSEKAAVLFFTGSSAVAIYLVSRARDIENRHALLGALCLIIVSPLTLLFPVDRIMYVGYVGINAYHNPTIWVLKPFALLAVALVVSQWRKEQTPGVGHSVLLTTLLILSAFAKPSFLIAFLPAFVFWLLIGYGKAPIRPMMAAFVVLLPALAVLGWQFWMTYSVAQVSLYKDVSGIVWAPFEVVGFRSGWLASKFMLSVAFPLMVLIVYRRQAIRDRGLQLAWLIFLFGAAYGYLLAESGPRMMQGNFLWSAQIGLFILFVKSFLFIMKAHDRDTETGRFVFRACLFVFALHVANGLVFYGAEYSSPVTYLWP